MSARASMRALDDRSRPTWELLGGGDARLSRSRAQRHAMEFAVVAPADLEPFQIYLGGCIGSHRAPLLFWALQKMERFVYAVDLKPLLADPHPLLVALDAWGDALDAHYIPHEESMRPMFSRYLQHRFATLYTNQDGELREAADTVCAPLRRIAPLCRRARRRAQSPGRCPPCAGLDQRRRISLPIAAVRSRSRSLVRFRRGAAGRERFGKARREGRRMKMIRFTETGIEIHFLNLDSFCRFCSAVSSRWARCPRRNAARSRAAADRENELAAAGARRASRGSRFSS